MADPLSVAASVTGLVVPALHGIRHLLDDIRKIVGAPTTVESLKQDLTSLDTTLESLKAIEDAEWTALGDIVATQSKTAISTCKRACETFHSDLQRWTRRSQGGKLSWRDRANIGFFKEHQIEAISEHLRSCKLICSNVIGIATLYSSIHNTHTTENVENEVVKIDRDIAAAAVVTDARLKEVETSLAKIKVVDKGENDDLIISALSQLKKELMALKSAQTLLPELKSRTKIEVVQKIARDSQNATTSVTFGDNNEGFQVGVSYGNISGLRIGRGTQ